MIKNQITRIVDLIDRAVMSVKIGWRFVFNFEKSNGEKGCCGVVRFRRTGFIKLN